MAAPARAPAPRVKLGVRRVILTVRRANVQSGLDRLLGMRIAKSLSTFATAKRLGVSTAALRAWTDSGVGPLPNTKGRYDCAEVSAWMVETDAQLRAESAVTAT